MVNYYLQGVTYSMRPDSTKDILPETKVTLLDEKGDIMQDYVTGNDGKFLFRVYENENTHSSVKLMAILLSADNIRLLESRFPSKH